MICIDFRTGLTEATAPIFEFFEKDVDVSNINNIPNELPDKVEEAFRLMNIHCTAK